MHFERKFTKERKHERAAVRHAMSSFNYIIYRDVFQAVPEAMYNIDMGRPAEAMEILKTLLRELEDLG